MIALTKYLVVFLLSLNVSFAADAEERRQFIEDQRWYKENFRPTTTCLTLEHNGKKRDLEIIETNVIDFYTTNKADIKAYFEERHKEHPDQTKIQEIGKRMRDSKTNIANDRRRNKILLREEYEKYRTFVHQEGFRMKTKETKITTAQYLKIVDALRHFICR